METSGKPYQYNLYLRGYAYDLQFQDTKDPALQVKALDDYKETISLGGAYAQADYDRLAALQVQAAPLSWQVPQMLTPDEMGRIIGVAGGDLFYVKSAYQREDGSRLGVGYALRSVQEPSRSAINRETNLIRYRFICTSYLSTSYNPYGFSPYHWEIRHIFMFSFNIHLLYVNLSQRI